MKGTTSRPWGVSPGRDERAGHSVSAVPSHPCASSRAGVVLPPVRPAGDKGRKLSSRARGFVRDAVAVHLTVNRLARRGVHEQLPSRSPRHSPSATSSCPPARLRVCTPTAPPPLQPVLPLGLGYSSPLDRELLHFTVPPQPGMAGTQHVPMPSIPHQTCKADTACVTLRPHGCVGQSRGLPWCACTQHLGWT